ncbi:hypothetical protein DFJ58DRAFT_807949, partial [Suillus subalutaceus]|uniref:uncharacterized protein n=1 Tax=Suillus subalutaceus TaxID=48586 RepID=UPI001B85C969
MRLSFILAVIAAFKLTVSMPVADSKCPITGMCDPWAEGSCCRGGMVGWEDTTVIVTLSHRMTCKAGYEFEGDREQIDVVAKSIADDDDTRRLEAETFVAVFGRAWKRESAHGILLPVV